MNDTATKATTWDDIQVEKLSDTITRQMLNGANTTVARILLARGAVVPPHSHESEQVSLILSGALQFVIGGKEILVSGGQMVLIPPHVVHSARALEDTVDLDIFSPRREDWIRKDDAYLRG